MRSRTVRLIAGKELRDTLRDRRTLFVALLLPLLLYPALLLGLTQVIGVTQRNLEREEQRILAEGVTPDLVLLLREQRLLVRQSGEEGLPGDLAARLRENARAVEGEEEVESSRKVLRRTLQEHGLSGAVLGAAEFAERTSQGRPSAATLLFDPTDEPSRMAARKVAKALQNFAALQREALRARYPAEAERLRFAEEPVHVAELETASPSEKGAYSFAPLLGLLVVLMALTGAFYPAVDLAAGEKERGTLETLLVAPVARREIVLGKFLAVWVIAVITALANLFVMGVTFSKVAGMIGSGTVAFHLPAGAAATVTLILVPTAALFGAVALALSSFATSYKEGQHYLSPLFLVATPLAMVALLPNVEIGYALALVPVSNVVLLVKTMLLGGEAAGPALVAAAATAAYAGVALWVAVALFRRESVLFRSGAGRGFDPASLEAARARLPSPGTALLLFFAVLALMFFLSGGVPDTPGQAVWMLLKAQLAAVLLPTLLIAWKARVDFRRTFLLRGAAPRFWPAVLVAAGATAVLVGSLYQRFLPEPEVAEGFTRIVELIHALPFWLYFALLAFLPPVCEELLCRGFLLSAFRPRYGTAKAVILVAALFAVLHLDFYRLPATFVAGLAAGYVCVRTGSILMAILFHTAYNGVIATPELAIQIRPDATQIGGAALLLLLCAAFLEQQARGARRRV